MKNLILVSVLLLSQVSSAVGYPTISDLTGNWTMQTAKCSSGKDIEALQGLAAVFKLDDKQLHLEMTDKNGKKDDLFSGRDIILQEDLLSFSTKLGTATVKVQLKDKKTLILRVPVLGVGPDCPSMNELQVLTFTKQK